MPSDCSSVNRPWKDVHDRLRLLEILDSLERKGASALYGGVWSHLEEDERDAYVIGLLLPPQTFESLLAGF